MKMTYRWNKIIFIGSLLGIHYLAGRVCSSRLESALSFLFLKIWVQHKDMGKISPIGGLLSHFWELLHPQTHKINHRRWILHTYCTNSRTHTHTLTIWPINLHSRQLETLLWHPFGWVLPPKRLRLFQSWKLIKHRAASGLRLTKAPVRSSRFATWATESFTGLAPMRGSGEGRISKLLFLQKIILSGFP